MLYINNENDNEQNNKIICTMANINSKGTIRVYGFKCRLLLCVNSEADIFGNMYHYSSTAAIFTQLDKNSKTKPFLVRIEGYGDGSEKME